MACDNVVPSVGFQEENSLYNALEGKADELYPLGDARRVANIMYAAREAFEVANYICPLFSCLFWAVLLLCVLSHNSILKH